MRLPATARPLLVVSVLLSALLAGGAVRSVQDVCGPFSDVPPAFCPYVNNFWITIGDLDDGRLARFWTEQS